MRCDTPDAESDAENRYDDNRRDQVPCVNGRIALLIEQSVLHTV
jgi:hypothetical protein